MIPSHFCTVFLQHLLKDRSMGKKEKDSKAYKGINPFKK